MPEWLSLEWFYPHTLRSFVWASPHYIYVALGVPLLFLVRWLLNNAKKKLSLGLSKGDYKNSWHHYLRFSIPLFLSLGLFALCLSLARPQKALENEDGLTEGLNLILALDVSESMSERDLKPNRLEAAKTVALQFLENRSNDKIGLVVFAGEAFTLCPLTSDYGLLKNYLSDVSSSLVSSSGTAIGSAIATSINRLRETPGESRGIILLSDGDNTAGSLAPETATDLAKSFGIRIYTIAIGKETSLSKKTLTNVAQSSNGYYYSAKSKEALNDVFKQIDTLEKVRFENSAIKDVKDYYYTYLNWAVLLFLLTFILKNTFLGNVLDD